MAHAKKAHMKEHDKKKEHHEAHHKEHHKDGKMAHKAKVGTAPHHKKK